MYRMASIIESFLVFLPIMNSVRTGEYVPWFSMQARRREQMRLLRIDEQQKEEEAEQALQVRWQQCALLPLLCA